MFRTAIFLLLAGLLVVALAQKPEVKTAPAPPTSAASGEEMYVSYCAVCHGKDGKGNGPAAPAMKTPPTDLTQLARNNGGKFPTAHVFQVIRGDAAMAAHGSKDMPVWGPVFRALSGHDDAKVQLRIRNLTSHIETMQAK